MSDALYAGDGALIRQGAQRVPAGRHSGSRRCSRRVHRGFHWLLGGLVAIHVGMAAGHAPTPPPGSQSCSISVLSVVNFGIVNVLAGAPNTAGVGTLAVHCSAGTPAYTVALSAGQSGQFSSRTLRAGAEMLHYNLYIDSSRRVIWGDGSGGSSVVKVSTGGLSTLNVFGSVPAGQDVPAGSYADDITATLDF